MQQQHATPTTTVTDQLRISTGAGGVHDAAIIATCIRAHIKGRAWKELELSGCGFQSTAIIANTTLSAPRCCEGMHAEQ